MSAMKYICVCLSVFRLCELWMSWSYLQPDQFFQSTEPIAGHVFDTKVLMVWEFNTSFPLRNIFFPQLISRPVFTLLKWLEVNDNPFVVFLCPRIVITLLSFICDYSLYTMSRYSQRSTSQVIPSLVIFGSSYITLTYLTQTFSNTIETILLSIVLMYVFKSMATNNYKTYNTTILGTVLSFGLFNRPTFVLFAFPSVFFWAKYDGNTSRKTKRSKSWSQFVVTIITRGLSLIPSFGITCLALIIFDTQYYTNNNIFDLYEDVINLRFEELVNSLVITPLNFIIYNTKTSNLANHGLHPQYFHALVSVPLTFSILGLLAYYDIFDKLKKLSFGRTSNKCNFELIALLTFIIPLIGFSLIPHQEPRFLIPSLVPLCYLYGKPAINSKLLFILWIIINTILVIFYAFIHQSGVIKGLFDLNDIIKQNSDKRIDIVFSRTYLPPRHLLNIDNKWSDIQIHDLSVLNFPQPLNSQIRELRDQNATDFYLLIPSCLSEQLIDLFTKHGLNYKLLKQYFPHFTAEDIGSSLNILKTSLYNYREAFSLNLWNVSIN
ncbi:GPI mannosyltransferase 4-like [Oppia nitens]|uniref:GPI mannosyltransferase 4-like n=1 Tax=Oppia nitens TaxID=1686743 RepID=UPI0023DAFF16|nr:GPI mannosyltransferase 4-like [Oppia nitens]